MPNKSNEERRYIRPERPQRSLNLKDIDAIEDDLRLKEASFTKTLSPTIRLEVLAQVCGFSAKSARWGAQKLEAAYVWPPVRVELRRFESSCIRGDWKSRVPVFRLVHALVHSGLRYLGRGTITGEVIPENRWTGDGRPTAAAAFGHSAVWSAEDHYTRFVLQLLGRLNGPGPNEWTSPLISWIRDASVEWQIYILYSMLLLYHYERKAVLRDELPIRRRIGAFFTGKKHDCL